MRALQNKLKEYLRPYYLKWLYFRLFPKAKPEAFGKCSARQLRPLPHCAPAVRDIPHPEGKLDFLFLPMADWHSRLQRTQHLARSLAGSSHRSFLLNPHLGRELPSPPLPWRARCFVSTLEPYITELHVGLTREPVYHHRLLAAAESRLLAIAWADLVATFDVRRAVQIVSLPVWTEAAKATRKRFGFPIVYDCHDLLGGFENMAPGIVEAEAALLETADLVVFSSAWLLEASIGAHPGVGKKSVVIRNAVDFAHFNTGASGHAARQGTVVGYIGSLNHWFQMEPVRRAAASHPEWRFVLIGRVEDARIHELRRLPNVELRGEVPYANIPKHLAEFDVALIPFARIPLTLATNPIKIYEYFSLGLPVVCTPLPETEQFADLVYLAEAPDDFTAQIMNASRENDAGLRARRRALAESESWDKRAASLVAALEVMLRRD